MELLKRKKELLENEGERKTFNVTFSEGEL